MIIRACLTLLVAGLLALPAAQAECCTEDSDGTVSGGRTKSQCKDGTSGTPCCGIGSCNIFCCNCDHGCRKKPQPPPPPPPPPVPTNCKPLSLLRRDIHDDGTHAKFASIDADASGKISLDEYLAWASPDADSEYRKRNKDYFHSFDRNGDGHIELWEVESLLGVMRWDSHHSVHL